MTKSYYKPPTSIDQAEIIPFPARYIIREKAAYINFIAAEAAINALEKFYQKGQHYSPLAVYGFCKEEINKQYVGGAK